MSAAPSFPQQRLVLVALLLGVVVYAGIVAYVLHEVGRPVPDGVPPLDMVAIVGGASVAVAATSLRFVLAAVAERAEPAERPARRFVAHLVPVGLLEGGCLLGITTWLINGDPVPGLLVAGVLFAIAVVFVPFRDPGAL